jgi:tRNA (cytidine/uridine-2'-O-)-methyltransferase
MHIILYQPEIPENTGNIVRTCRATNARLSLITPLGFSISNRRVKRAGLDYWDEVEIDVNDSLEKLLLESTKPFFFFSSKATTPYTEAPFELGSRLIFGSETSGLPSHFFDRYPSKFYTIPMAEGARCLNLSNSVAIVLYESHRQLNFETFTPQNLQ